MTEEELAKFLEGKVIKEAIVGSYMGRPILETLVFDDGSSEEGAL